MKRPPMILQLALILFCVMAIPATILYWYSGAQILRHSEDAIAESALAGLDANRQLNENALKNLSRTVVRFASSQNNFRSIRDLPTFEALNADYDNVSNARAVLLELQSMKSNTDGVYSIFFYLDGADYVISSDMGITRLADYEPIDWMTDALSGRGGISGVWYPRRLESGEFVVSFVLPLNRLTTSTRGSIVLNLLESQVADYLRSSVSGDRGSMLLAADGTVISHSDKSLLLSDGGQLPFVAEILGGAAPAGYTFHEHGGERLLYTWQRSDATGWVYLSVNSMDELMTKTRSVRQSIILLTVAIILIGTVLTAYLATWLSRPVRELVRTMRKREDLEVTDKNEMAFLGAAFQQLQEEEEGLYRLLREHEQDSRSVAVHNLLRGEALPPKHRELLSGMFPLPFFMVAIVSIDSYTRYVGNTNPETRSYHRYLLIQKCEALFPRQMHIHCVYRGEGCIALVMNLGQQEHDRGCERAKRSLLAVKGSAAEVFGHTVTIGVSTVAKGTDSLRDCVLEAAEATKRRMVEGGDSLILWRQEGERGKKYLYPANSERRILNYLGTGDLEQIVGELRSVREQILAAEYVSYDNILFIYNQLVGATIKYLGENNISIGRIFAERGNLYTTIAAVDTLAELEEYLRGFFDEIVQYLARDDSHEIVGHGERVLRYLDEHFREDIVFEELAGEMGISYSYMRKLVRQLTGKSLIDYINLLRIREAGRLLLDTELSVTQIALAVGYHNVQSINRFFRKYEGMSPSEYKAANQKS